MIFLRSNPIILNAISKNVSKKNIVQSKHWLFHFEKCAGPHVPPRREIAASFVSKGIPTNPKIPDAMVHGQHGLPKFWVQLGVEGLEFFKCFHGNFDHTVLYGK